MTSPDAYSFDDAKFMWRVLALWMRGTSTMELTTITARLRSFPRVSAEALETKLPRADFPLNLKKYGWLIGDPLPRYVPKVIPVATVSLDSRGDTIVNAVFRVAIFSERGEGTVHAEGWRFEQAEPLNPPREGETRPRLSAHPYNHAQAIKGWSTRASCCFLHPDHSADDACGGVDECGETIVDADRHRAAEATLTTHPAFPLLSKTLTGLALNLIATLYGAQEIEKLVHTAPLLARVGGEIAADIEALCPVQ